MEKHHCAFYFGFHCHRSLRHTQTCARVLTHLDGKMVNRLNCSPSVTLFTECTTNTRDTNIVIKSRIITDRKRIYGNKTNRNNRTQVESLEKKKLNNILILQVQVECV